LTRLERDRNVNYDFMVRYVINPWSAFSMGYNTNATNFEIIETENGNELVDSSRLTEDGKQFFVKFSYLFLP
jgi:hypothetical protein